MTSAASGSCVDGRCPRQTAGEAVLFQRARLAIACERVAGELARRRKQHRNAAAHVLGSIREGGGLEVQQLTAVHHERGDDRAARGRQLDAAPGALVDQREQRTDSRLSGGTRLEMGHHRSVAQGRDRPMASP